MEEPAKLPVADNRQRAQREAGPGGQEVQLKSRLRRPRAEADAAAVQVKEAQVVVRDPVTAEDQVVIDVRRPYLSVKPRAPSGTCHPGRSGLAQLLRRRQVLLAPPSSWK